AARITLRMQQIIAYDSGVADTVDPLAGSYFVETLTDELEQAAWEYIRKIDDLGGAVHAIESGYIQQQIGEAAYRYQKRLETGEQTIVGLNRFVTDTAGEAPRDTFRRSEERRVGKECMSWRVAGANS